MAEPLLAPAGRQHIADSVVVALGWVAQRQVANVRRRIARFRRRFARRDPDGRWELALSLDAVRVESYWRHLAHSRLDAFAEGLWDALCLEVTAPTGMRFYEVAAAMQAEREAWIAELVDQVVGAGEAALTARLARIPAMLAAGEEVEEQLVDGVWRSGLGLTQIDALIAAAEFKVLEFAAAVAASR